MRRPNVLFLHCHDLGRHLGVYGVAGVSSPCLDRLARDSIVFERAYATSPQCSPARASLMTGLYPQQHGVMGLTHGQYAWDLKSPKDHLAWKLVGRGYRTQLLGVHHESRVLPDDVVAERLGFNLVETGGRGDQVAERTVQLLREASSDPDTPFYLQVGFHEPHRVDSVHDTPGVMGFLGDYIEVVPAGRVEVPAYLEDTPAAREEMAELQAAITYMDHQVGVVLQELDRLGMSNDTLVIFTTDHGLALPRAKGSLYEAGLEVALIVRLPAGTQPSGRRIACGVSHIDIMPTILDVADGTRGNHPNSLLPLIFSGEQTDKPIFGQLTYHAYYDPKRSIRSGDLKLITNFSSAPIAMDSTQSWHRRCTPKGLAGANLPASLPFELYDLRADPAELNDLSADPAHAADRERLTRWIYEWMESVDDPLLNGAVTPPQHHACVKRLRAASTFREISDLVHEMVAK